MDQSFDLSNQYQIFKMYKKEWAETKKSGILYKCITANTSAIWQHAAHATDQLLLLDAKQESYKKACLLTKNIGRIFLQKIPAGRKKR